jgi:CBS domain-containing protein
MNLEQNGSPAIIRAPRSCRLRQAAELMKLHHVGALIVTEDRPGEGKAIGIVTDRDLVLKAMAEGIGPDDATLGDVMTEGLATVSADAGLQAAMEAMRTHGVRRLGLTAGAGELVGVVSFDDLVAALAAGLGNLAGVIRSGREREIEQNPPLPLVPL